ncbi:hypothetical protein KQX54_011627 [Cotesia glomerata]|uniref:Uncharacterized protein n=1 Tax=Cotesia glomerata TaxID=32391 RepID=A0AAV7HV03_COTGL|nr:hypothetical protein KQX54_011627 [Cotesia glomerata]
MLRHHEPGDCVDQHYHHHRHHRHHHNLELLVDILALIYIDDATKLPTHMCEVCKISSHMYDQHPARSLSPSSSLQSTLVLSECQNNLSHDEDDRDKELVLYPSDNVDYNSDGNHSSSDDDEYLIIEL